MEVNRMEQNQSRLVFDPYGQDVGYTSYKKMMSLEKDEDTDDDISEYLKCKNDFINPMEFSIDTCKDVIFGYIKANFISPTRDTIPCMILGIFLDYYCDHSMHIKIKNYHNKSIPKQLKSLGNPLNDIIFLINKTASNPDINLYDAMIIIQQKQITENRAIITSSKIFKQLLFNHSQQSKLNCLISGFNRKNIDKFHDKDILDLINHLCVLYYIPWYLNKETLSIIEVSQWIAFLGKGYQQYQQQFILNGIDGEFMNELDDEILSELIINPQHRDYILQSWSRL